MHQYLKEVVEMALAWEEKRGCAVTDGNCASYTRWWVFMATTRPGPWAIPHPELGGGSGDMPM